MGMVPSEHPRQLNQRRAQVLALNDTIDHAVVEGEFCGLKIIWNLTDTGLFAHAESGKPDKGPRFGKDHIGNGRVTGENARHRWVSEHCDVRHARTRTTLRGGGGFRHLHQREQSLLHSRAAGGTKQNCGVAGFGGPLKRASNFLSVYRAHRTTHKVKVRNADRHRYPIQLCGSASHRIVAGLLFHGRRKLLAVLGELKRIERGQLLVALLKTARIEGDFNALWSREAMMVPAIGTNAQVLFKVDREDYFLAVSTLQEPFRFIRRPVIQGMKDTAQGGGC